MHLTHWLQQVISQLSGAPPSLLRSTPTRVARRLRAAWGSGFNWTEVLECRTLLSVEAILLTEPGSGPEIPPTLLEGGPAAFQFSDGNGWDTTVTNGSGLIQGESVTLTWGIVIDGSPISPAYSGESSAGSNLISVFDTIFGAGPGGSDLTQRPWFTIFSTSLNRLSQLTSVNYVYQPITTSKALPGLGDATTPDILIGGHSIDGQSGSNTLAYNYYPLLGDMVIDTDNVAFYSNTANSFRATRNVLMHEFGHGLGLDHVESDNADFLMEPFINTAFDGPQLDDILSLQRAYGDPLERNGGNDSTLTATSLGTINVGSSVSIGTLGDSTVVSSSETEFISLNDESDVDFYRFTTTTSASLNLTLTPRGTTYLQGPENETQTSFNSKSQSDLRIDLIGPDGSTILRTANQSGIGSSETITGFDLLTPGTYYVKVSTATPNHIQLYGLTVGVAAGGVIDAGDAPDSYGTLRGSDGAKHFIATTQSTLYIGSRVDSEADASPGGRANGDDTAGNPDDEDGLLEAAQDLILTAGSAPVVRLRATNTTLVAATLYGWIDFNRDSVFDNATERTSIMVPAGTTNGTFILTFPTIASNVTTGLTYARFRLSSDVNAANPTGAAVGGEVEDYAATIVKRTGLIADTAKTQIVASGTHGGPTLSDGDQFGSAVTAIGDLDGDGITDLAVSAIRDDTNGTDRGAVYIQFMNANGTVRNRVKIASSTNGGPSLADSALFGSSIALLGDLDADGVTDLAVGASHDATGGTDRGAVYVLLMNANGTVKSSIQLASGTNGVPSLSNGDEFGSAVSAIGDLDGDGIVDLAIGARGDDTGGTDQGAVYITCLNANGTAKSTLKLASNLNGMSALTSGDGFGNALASLGDLNNDGVTDLAVGARDDDTGGDARGAVYVLFLNANGSVKATSKIAHDVSVGLVLADADHFGSSITSLGDLNADGLTDISVGISGDDTGGVDRGAIQIVLLNSNGTVKGGAKVASGLNGGPTLADDERFGQSVAFVGDLDGDGLVDIAVGAPGADTGGDQRGAIRLLFLQPFDASAPVLTSFTRLSPATSPTNADTVVFLATFNEPVAGVNPADFAVTGTTATVTAVAMIAGSNGVQWAITVTGGNLANLNGTVGLNLAATPTINDLTGNPLPKVEPPTDQTFVIDNTAPTLVITPDGTLSNAATITFTFQFSETVADFDASDVVVTNGTAGTFTAVDGDTYRMVVTPIADGPVTVNVAAHAATDLATNAAAAASAVVNSDRTPPALVITPNGTTTTFPTITFTFQFAETVTGFTASDITLSNGTKGVFSAVDGDTYTLVVNAISDGAVVVSVPFNAAVDAAGNPNALTSSSVIVDRTSPTLVITPAAVSTNADPLVFTFQFNEPVIGFDDTDVTVTNGTKGLFTAIDGDTYTLLVIPIVEGSVGVSVGANAATDNNAHGNVGATAAVISDRTAPTLVITPNASFSNTPTITFTFQFSETVFGFDSTDISITNGAKGAFSTLGGGQYTLVVAPASDGNVGVSVNANAAADAASNGSPAASAAVFSDRTLPTLAVTPSGTFTNADSILLTFQFSEAVTGFDVADITLTNGTPGAFTAVDADTYTLAVTPQSDGIITVDVRADAARDATANGNLAVHTTVVSDRTAPVLTVSPNNTSSNASLLTFTFQFNEPVFGFDSSDIVVTNATIGQFTAVDASTYTLVVSPLADGSVTATVAANAARDAANNPTVQTTAAFTSDRTFPDLTITPTGLLSNANQVTFTFQFTEVVTGFNTNDVVVSNGTKGSFSVINGSTYQLVVTPIADGTVGVTVAANTSQDLAGNNNTSASASIITDRTAPRLTILPNNSSTSSNVITFTFQFSEPVSGFDISDISLTNGTAGTFTVIDSHTFQLEVTPLAEGPVLASVVAGAASDAVTNLSLAATATVTSDHVAPLLSITPDVTLLNGVTILLTFQFSEPVFGFDASDIVVTNATQGTFTALDSDTYTLILTPTADGLVSATVPFNAAHDAAGNPTAQATNSVVSDRTIPSLTITPNGSISNSSSITFVFQFSEPMNGFDASDIAITNGTKGLFVAVDSDTYTLVVTPATDGIVKASVPANATQDNAGNANPATSSTITSDQTVPNLIITPNSGVTNASLLTFVFQFSETVTGFDVSDIVLTNGTKGTFTALDGDTYTLLVMPSGDGPVTASVAANHAQDAAGNPNAPASGSITSDRTGPTLTITPANGPTNANPVLYTFQFNESVTGFDISDISVMNGAKGVFTALDADTYTLAVTPTLDGPISVTVNALAAIDAALNGNVLATSTVMSDRTLPTASILPAGTVTSAAAITFTIQFSESVTGFDANDVIVTNGTKGALTKVDDDTYTLVVSPLADGTVTVAFAVNIATDLALNPNTPASASIVSDRSGPVFTSSSAPSVAENSSTAFTVAANDTHGPVRYAIQGGADASRFAIDPTTGLVQFLAPPDYETPDDADANRTYLLQISATDALSQSTLQNLTLTLTAVNDNSPVFTSLPTFSVVENTTTVGTVVSTDADLPGQTLSYLISGGLDAARFAITATGQLRFVSPPDYETPLDSNRDNVYQVQIMASDGAGRSTSQAIAVTVTNENEAPTSLTLSSAAIVENNAANAIIGTMTATDPDTASTLSYSLVTGEGSSDNSTFAIIGNTLKILTVADRETHSTYSIRIRATDQNGLGFEQQFTIQVLDANEAPSITPLADQVILEDTAATTLEFSISDPETASANLSVTATSSNAALIPISGLTLAGQGSDRTISFTPASNQFGVATITITVSDGVLTAVETFLVTVQPVDDPTVLALSPLPLDYRVSSRKVSTLDSAASITDSDSPHLQFNGSSLTISGQATKDTLTIIKQNNISLKGKTVLFGKIAIGTFSGGTMGVPLTIKLNSSATLTSIQSLMRSVGFKSTDKTPGRRTLKFEITGLSSPTTTPPTREVNVAP